MVELGCGRTCMKYILFVINFLFFILGAVAFGLGIWALVDKNKMNVLTKVGAENSDFNITGLLESAAIVLIVGGAAILIIGFLGCWGAYKQSQCMLCLYGFLLFLIIAIELAAIIAAAVFKGQVEDEVQDFIKKNINTTYDGRIDTSEEFSLGLDFAQVYFHCCGVGTEAYKDFDGAVKWNRTTSTGATLVVPPTCCKLKDDDAYFDKPSSAVLVDTNCPLSPSQTNSYWKKGCWTSIEDWMLNRVAVVIGIASAILVLEIICLVFACCIVSALRKGLE